MQAALRQGLTLVNLTTVGSIVGFKIFANRECPSCTNQMCRTKCQRLATYCYAAPRILYGSCRADVQVACMIDVVVSMFALCVFVFLLKLSGISAALYAYCVRSSQSRLVALLPISRARIWNDMRHLQERIT